MRPPSNGISSSPASNTSDESGSGDRDAPRFLPGPISDLDSRSPSLYFDPFRGASGGATPQCARISPVPSVLAPSSAQAPRASGRRSGRDASMCMSV